MPRTGVWRGIQSWRISTCLTELKFSPFSVAWIFCSPKDYIPLRAYTQMRACLSGATSAYVKDIACVAGCTNQSLVCSECGSSSYANKPPTIYSKYKIYTSQNYFPKVFRSQISCCRESYPENSAQKISAFTRLHLRHQVRTALSSGAPQSMTHRFCCRRRFRRGFFIGFTEAASSLPSAGAS